MLTFYIICAGVGGTIMVIQFLLLLIGLDHFGVEADGHLDFHGLEVQDLDMHDVDLHDVDGHGIEDHGHGTSWFLGVLSIRTITAALAFFGLVGIATSESLPPYSGFLLAVAAGGCAMVLMAWLMRSLHRLKSEGNVQIENAVGQMATVYLTVPGSKSGAGKITVKVQDRTMEYQAMTAGDALPTGTPVMIVGVMAPDMLEVAPATDEQGE